MRGKRHPWLTIMAALGLVLAISILSQAAVTQSQKLPPGWAALVPEGTKLTSQTYLKTEMNAEVRFNSEKTIEQNRIVEYRCWVCLYAPSGMAEFDNMRYSGYKQQHELNVKETIESCGKASSSVTRSQDAPVVTDYPWGKGITQRKVSHYVGAGNGPDFVYYDCFYYGLMKYGFFELSVEGITDRTQADDWAKNVAAKALKSTYANLGN